MSTGDKKRAAFSPGLAATVPVPLAEELAAFALVNGVNSPVFDCAMNPPLRLYLLNTLRTAAPPLRPRAWTGALMCRGTLKDLFFIFAGAGAAKTYAAKRVTKKMMRRVAMMDEC